MSLQNINKQFDIIATGPQYRLFKLSIVSRSRE